MIPTAFTQPGGTSPVNRRQFLLTVCGVTAGATGALVLVGCGGSGETSAAASPAAQAAAAAGPPAASTTPEQDVLNFALNLQYLGAQFYAFALTGSGLSPAVLTGAGSPGIAHGGRAVAFADPVVGRLAQEIAADKLADLNALRVALGAAAVAQPRIDLSAEPAGAFSAAAEASGVIAAGASFDPYGDDGDFLLAASMFEDVSAAAHRAAMPMLVSPGAVQAQTAAAANGAYHAGLVRTTLGALALTRPDLPASIASLAAYRAGLDGSPPGDDVVIQGDVVTDVDVGDSRSVPFSRNAQRALRVIYAQAGAASSGGFFPDGLNGVIRDSG